MGNKDFKCAVIVIDDIDLIAEDEDDKTCKVTNELLKQIDAIREEGKRILVFLTVTDSGKISERLLKPGGLVKATMDLPDLKERYLMFKYYLEKFTDYLDCDIDILSEKLAMQSEITCAEIKKLVGLTVLHSKMSDLPIKSIINFEHTQLR